MTTFLIAVAMWAVPATALLALLAAGRRRRDRQAADRARALAARRTAASWGRNDLPAPDARHTPSHGHLRPRHRRPR